MKAKSSLQLVNLALAFARRGIKTGLLDTDIFGPSVPTLLNLSGEPRLDESEIYFILIKPRTMLIQV